MQRGKKGNDGSAAMEALDKYLRTPGPNKVKPWGSFEPIDVPWRQPSAGNATPVVVSAPSGRQESGAGKRTAQPSVELERGGSSVGPPPAKRASIAVDDGNDGGGGGGGGFESGRRSRDNISRGVGGRAGSARGGGGSSGNGIVGLGAAVASSDVGAVPPVDDLEEKAAFWSLLCGVLECWGDGPITSFPMVQYRPLDLFKLCYSVLRRGGYLTITNQLMWPPWVYRRLPQGDSRAGSVSSLSLSREARALLIEDSAGDDEGEVAGRLDAVLHNLADDIEEPRPWSVGWEQVVTELALPAKTIPLTKLRIQQWFERLLFPLEMRVRDACTSLGMAWPIVAGHPLHGVLLAGHLFRALRAALPTLFVVNPVAASIMMRCACGHRHEYPPRVPCAGCSGPREALMQCSVCGAWQHASCVARLGGERSPFACDLCSVQPWVPVRGYGSLDALPALLALNVELPIGWVVESDGWSVVVSRLADVFGGPMHPRCLHGIQQLRDALSGPGGASAKAGSGKAVDGDGDGGDEDEDEPPALEPRASTPPPFIPPRHRDVTAFMGPGSEAPGHAVSVLPQHFAGDHVDVLEGGGDRGDPVWRKAIVRAVHVKESGPVTYSVSFDGVFSIPVEAAVDDNVDVIDEEESGDEVISHKTEAVAVAVASMVRDDVPQDHVRRRQLPFVVMRDVSGGSEKTPIRCVNEVDDADLVDEGVEYIRECIVTDPAKRVLRRFPQCNCTCEVGVGCLAPPGDVGALVGCECIAASKGTTYTRVRGLLVLTKEVNEGLQECHPGCHCSADSACCNVLLSRGVKFPLEVFRTSYKGWGVRCSIDIPAGGFVCEYVGDVITDEMGHVRGTHYDNDMGRSYLMDLDHFNGDNDEEGGAGDSSPHQQYTLLAIDGSRRGNISRFINHSCEPNLRLQPILYGSKNSQLYRIGLFAIARIRAGTELAYDYCYRGSTTDTSVRVPGLHIPCKCGAGSCNGRLI